MFLYRMGRRGVGLVLSWAETLFLYGLAQNSPTQIFPTRALFVPVQVFRDLHSFEHLFFFAFPNAPDYFRIVPEIPPWVVSRLWPRATASHTRYRFGRPKVVWRSVGYGSHWSRAPGTPHVHDSRYPANTMFGRRVTTRRNVSRYRLSGNVGRSVGFRLDRDRGLSTDTAVRFAAAQR